MENTIIKDDEVVHCKTEEEARAVFEIANKLGLTWSDGEEYGENTYWGYYKNKTAYSLVDGEVYSLDHFPEEKNNIIKAKEFLSRHNIISKKRDIHKELQELINNDPEKESILQEAERIVNGDRQADYADPVENFDRIAKIASILNGREMTSKECCIVMIAVKLSREANKPKRDNRVDLCGYIHILDKIESKNK